MISEEIKELRAVAERLALGDAETRKLRGLFVDLIDVLLGRKADHPDVNGSGARFAPPPASQFAVGAPMVGPAPGSPAHQLAAAMAARALPAVVGVPAAGAAPDPAGPDAIAQLERELQEADESHPTNGGH